jgi:hypothetical protein
VETRIEPPTLREISPLFGITAEAYFASLPPALKELVEGIRAQKNSGTRPKPSSTLVDQSSTLTAEIRRSLLDTVAALVDENLTGRSDMCSQFASLLRLGLEELGVSARIVCGKAMYYSNSRELFRWDHVWLRIGSEVVDGNLDILNENPMVPSAVLASPFWGEVRNIPSDRRLRESNDKIAPIDEDVEEIWWPELKSQLEPLKRLVNFEKT